MLPNGVLANRDFRLLFAGRSVSLLGDGAFLVALAWQAYTLSNAPTALALLGIAMTVPLIALLLFGGVVSDRHSRRRVMLLADLMRAVLLALLAALAISGTLHLWQMMVTVALYGSAQAFFDPASDAILPELLPASQLGQANALEQVVRPLALRLAGPAVGGVLVGVLGPGSAFLADGATFLASAATLWAMSVEGPVARVRAHTHARRGPDENDRSAKKRWALAGSGELREGWVYVRRHVWLWGTFASAGIAYLLFMGPAEVLLPFMVKHVLGGNGMQLGLVLGAGGLGSVACALAMARSGLPVHSMTFVYVVWGLATLAVAGYGLATAIWQLMLASLAFNLLETAGTIVWATMKQRHVPGHMLGRVSSLDWLISIGLLPVSFALTAPLSAALGVRATLIGAGVAGAAATLGGLLLPGMRGVDRTLGSASRGSVSPSSSAAGTI
ncbi:MAG TPA: MFS transporter [Solirubrobacteraceae bacterium]|jgi:DHA3 family tetracycline resistance protein-like MFS transporter